MSLRDKALNVLLWYAVIAWGVWVGGTLYQMLVIVPIWSSALPDSLRSFVEGTTYNQTIFNFFGPPFMAARLVPIAIALPLAWHSPAHRAPLAVALVCLIAIVSFTLLYVYPINEVLFEHAGGVHSASEIAALARTWIWADRIRFAVGMVAFVALLKAFRSPLSGRSAVERWR